MYLYATAPDCYIVIRKDILMIENYRTGCHNLTDQFFTNTTFLVTHYEQRKQYTGSHSRGVS